MMGLRTACQIADVISYWYLFGGVRFCVLVVFFLFVCCM